MMGWDPPIREQRDHNLSNLSPRERERLQQQEIAARRARLQVEYEERRRKINREGYTENGGMCGVYVLAAVAAVIAGLAELVRVIHPF